MKQTKRIMELTAPAAAAAAASLSATAEAATVGKKAGSGRTKDGKVEVIIPPHALYQNLPSHPLIQEQSTTYCTVRTLKSCSGRSVGIQLCVAAESMHRWS